MAHDKKTLLAALVATTFLTSGAVWAASSQVPNQSSQAEGSSATSKPEPGLKAAESQSYQGEEKPALAAEKR